MLAACGGGDGDPVAVPPVSEKVSTTTSEPSAASSTVGSSVSVTRVQGLVYRETQGVDGTTSSSTVDVYVPDGPGDRPAVVLLHGWNQPGSDREDTSLTALADEIAQLGATVFYFKWDTIGGLSSRSADDLSCIGSFVTARAAEFGARLDNVVIVGHSMGADAGSSLAFRSLDLPRGTECAEAGTPPAVKAFLGIGGPYGWYGKPVASDPETFLVRGGCSEDFREVAAADMARPGLTARESFELGGYGSMHLAPDELRVVLLVGTLDPNICTSVDVTRSFADALDTVGVEHELIEVEGAGHEDVINPHTDPGKRTISIIASILTTP